MNEILAKKKKKKMPPEGKPEMQGRMKNTERYIHE